MSNAALQTDWGNPDNDQTPPGRTTVKAWLIQGITLEGHRFRPSDWAERLCSLSATYKDRRLQYSAYLHPVQINGVKCVYLDNQLQEDSPAIHQQVMEFARSYHLSLMERI